MRIRVLVASNMMQHTATANALAAGGYDVTFVGPLLHNGPKLSVMPARYRALWERRRAEIDGFRVHSAWQVELLGRALGKFVAPERSVAATVAAFDLAALRYVRDCDILHFHSAVGLWCARRARALNRRVVADERGPHADVYRDLLTDEYARFGLTYLAYDRHYQQRIREEYLLADAIFVASEYAKRTFVERGVDCRKVFVAPYPVKLPASLPQRHEPDVFRVLFVGRVTLGKGVQYLLDAFRTMPERDAELLIVGPVDPSIRDYLDRAVARDPRVRVLGSVPREALPLLYASASVLVLPSLADSFGFVVAEAASHGVPVIVSDSTGIAAYLETGRSGRIVPSRDSDALAMALHATRDDPRGSQALAVEAHAALSRLTPQRYAAALLAGYAKVTQLTHSGAISAREG